MANDAVYWQILDNSQKALREEVRFESMGDGEPAGISPAAIVIRKLVPAKPDQPAITDEITPGILITLENRIGRPPSEGFNDREGVAYSFACQLIAADYDKTTLNLRTYLKWLEQIARLMSHYFARNAIISGDFGCVWDSMALTTTVLDPKYFVRHQKFVGAVIVTAFALETRGAT